MQQLSKMQNDCMVEHRIKVLQICSCDYEVHQDNPNQKSPNQMIFVLIIFISVVVVFHNPDDKEI